MKPTEPRLHVALDAAMNQIRTAASEAANRLCESLGSAAGSDRGVTRDMVAIAQEELRKHLGAFRLAFQDVLREKVNREVSARHEPRRRAEFGSWQTLTLVEDSEVEERMNFERIGQTISHACDWQLRELAAYMGSITGIGRADEDRNPLRAEVVGIAIYRGIEAITENADSRKILAREFAAAMALTMPDCYATILQNLQDRGIKPAGLVLRTVEGPGNQLTSANSGYMGVSGNDRLAPTGLPDSGQGPLSGHGAMRPAGAGGNHGPPSSFGGSGAPRSGRGGHAPGGPGGGSGYPAGSGYATGSGATGGGVRDSARSGYAPTGTTDFDPRGAAAAQRASTADAQLMTLLRRLTAVASHAGEFSDAPLGPSTSSGSAGDARAGATRGGRLGPASAFAAAAEAGGTSSGLMAVNLIREHRDELMQASTGKLDHMVIEVVGSLFDQILSDARVPPQMARQIARLQLPVLRVAMNDATFFSTRRHPVRRFINRIASLACAFDDFADGPGKPFLAQVAQLVQEIVDGDFDQIELYAAKLADLEQFIEAQTEDEAEQTGAVRTLAAKESELRIQQRYMAQLGAALAQVTLPGYLSDFLQQVWSQALVLATRRDGPDSDRARRFRRVGRDLVMSIQPKGSPVYRKKFLMQLPSLMKDLNEGMQLVGWPEAAQRELLGKLLPAHAESLKSQPLSELDHNLLAKQMEGIFNAPIAGTDAPSQPADLSAIEEAALERRFSPEEAVQVGLVQESTVDWDGKVDIDLSDAEIVEAAQAAVVSIDPELPVAPVPAEAAEAPEPSQGPQLIDHFKLGFAYQMHLKDDWQKVRLAHVSPGRSFFLFTRGARHQETISMTSRMLARMCETGRMRAVEGAHLMERATHRARQQLAVQKAQPRE